MKLFTYWRSSAAYRVRIALNLKNIPCELVPVHLGNGDHKTSEYLAQNPQGLVPALQHRGQLFVQSLAIIEYLDSVEAEPRLLPAEPAHRAHVAALAQAIACDVHPLNNLRVLKFLKVGMGQGDEAVSAWYGHWIAQTFAALEQWAKQYSSEGRYLYQDTISLADLCLVPQVYNARRFKVSLDAFPTLVAIDAHLCSLPAVIAASPEQQIDADR